MKNKKIIKYSIIFMVALLVIITIIILLLKINSKTTNNVTNEQVASDIQKPDTFQEKSDTNSFFKMLDILNGYTNSIKEINGDMYASAAKLKVSEEEMKKSFVNEGVNSIKKLTDKQYMKQSNFTDDSILRMANNYKTKGNYKEEVDYNLCIRSILKHSLNDKIDLYLVSTTIVNKETNFIIKIDNQNNNFSIFYDDFITKNNYNAKMDENEIKIDGNNIEKNEYNNIFTTEADDLRICEYLYSSYKNMMLNDPEYAFKMLEENYKNKRFQNYQNFVNFINSNINEIKNSSIASYKKDEIEGTNEYICIDNLGRYYVFKTDYLYKYNAILDVYTVDVDGSDTRYQNSTEQVKVGINVKKIFEAIKNKDYNYFYNKLDATFKNNNFKDEKQFEDYVTKNFTTNNIQLNNYRKVGDTYTYDATMQGEQAQNYQVMTKTFIVKLLQGTDFVLSFNIK